MTLLLSLLMFTGLSAHAQPAVSGPIAAPGKTCEVRSLTNDGSQYLIVDLSTVDLVGSPPLRHNLYAGGNIDRAKVIGHQIIFDDSGSSPMGELTKRTEFTLSPNKNEVIRVHVSGTDSKGNVVYRFVCGETLSSY